MTRAVDSLAALIEERFKDTLTRVDSVCDELTYELHPSHLVEACTALRDEADFAFEMLIDISGVDYLDYGKEEWTTNSSTDTGFSRGVERGTAERPLHPTVQGRPRRFAVTYHLLSISKNHRLRLKALCDDDEYPILSSVTSIWNCADWYEREVFDLFGILFEGHPDLRRILTDYGFIGHPFRKDFPLIGNVEMRYDPDKGRVVYEPVQIEPRTLVPKVIRDDNRYDKSLKDSDNDG